MPHAAAPPRCAALVGPSASGKTTLFEEMLFAAGSIERRGTVKDGTTVGDASPEARARGMSTELTAATLDYLGDPWTFLDCPGAVDLSAEAQAALMVADAAVVVCDPLPERAVTVSSLLRFLDERRIPHLVFLNKLDLPEATVRRTLEALQAVSSRPLALRGLPIRDEAGRMTGMVDLVSERAWRWRPHQPSALVALPERLVEEERGAREHLLETLADLDDRILEELLEDTVPPTGEIYDSLARDLAGDLVVPVLFGSAENGHGVHRLLKALRHEVPGPGATAARRGIPTDRGPVAEVFRTAFAGQAGKVSLARVWAGEVRDGMTLGRDRVGGLAAPFGRKAAPRGPAGAGEVVVLSRMASAATGDLLRGEEALPAGWPEPPEPLLAWAVTPSRPADEAKLTAALARLCQEDRSLRAAHDPETGELVVAGQGELQLGLALARLAHEHGLSVTRAAPTLPFRETITRPARIHARHKKQSGGHGEFADVHLEIAPQPRGAGFAFGDRITGGAVPRQYIPAVRKGVEASLARGPLGFPVVDVAVALVDGGFHPVDSSDMAFQKAAQKAMAEAMPGCGPVLLEPVVRVTVSAPAEFTPRVQRMITGRRGQLLGFDAKPGWRGWDEVQALMPEAECADMIVELRSLSLGQGWFERAFDHHREVTGRAAEKVTAARAEAAG